MMYLIWVICFVVFLVLTAVIGLLTQWVDRKVSARVQMRVGPPVLQPFWDIAKYCVKETCVPAGGSTALFLAAPVVGFAGASLASALVWWAMVFPSRGFAGDLIVVVYLLTMPAMAVVLGALASRNPLASLGGSREMKLMFAYELPFVLALLVPVVRLHTIRLGHIVLASRPAVGPLSGLLAVLVALLCTQAKLTLVPFDMPEAETELSGGAYIEYSGPPLALYKLTRAMMLFTMPAFAVLVFLGGLPWRGVWYVLGYLVLVVLVVLIRNTAPRMRIDQAIRFFWGPAALAALAAVLLAARGL